MGRCDATGPVSVAVTTLAVSLTPQLSADPVAYGANDIYDVSEYALGSYTLNVIFIQDDLLRDPNSSSHPQDPNGQVIHWTPAELTARQQRIGDAINFWNNASAARHHPNARLDVTINWINGGEAITVPDIGGEGSSIGYGDALAQVDPQYANYSDFTASRYFAHNTRQQLGTNWAWNTFVKPYNGRASAYLNGPHVNGYEDDPTWTYAHEFGHIFGALDEYGSADTGDRSGYLYAYNTNAQNLEGGGTNPNSVSAIMKVHGNYTFSEGTINQIGWTDTDSDTIPDILDTFPSLTLDTAASNPAAGDFVVDLDAHVTPLPSPDPYEGDYTINTIAAAEYRINSGDWLPLPALDGDFDGYGESMTLALAGLVAGEYDLDFRVFNSVDNFTLQSASFTSTLIPQPMSLALAVTLGLLAPARSRRSDPRLHR